MQLKTDFKRSLTHLLKGIQNTFKTPSTVFRNALKDIQNTFKRFSKGLYIAFKQPLKGLRACIRKENKLIHSEPSANKNKHKLKRATEADMKMKAKFMEI